MISSMDGDNGFNLTGGASALGEMLGRGSAANWNYERVVSKPITAVERPH